MQAKLQHPPVLNHDELIAQGSDPSIPFDQLVEAQHRTWREEARKLNATAPFFDPEGVEIEPNELLRAVLAL